MVQYRRENVMCKILASEHQGLHEEYLQAFLVGAACAFPQVHALFIIFEAEGRVHAQCTTCSSRVTLTLGASCKLHDNCPGILYAQSTTCISGLSLPVCWQAMSRFSLGAAGGHPKIVAQNPAVLLVGFEWKYHCFGVPPSG